MAWDDVKTDGSSTLTASEYNDMVIDQKGHKARHQIGGADALILKSIDAKAVVMNTGSYTGDNTANRAIPHNMAVAAKAIFIIANSAGAPSPLCVIVGTSAWCTMYSVNYPYSVTTSDTTNFYVGNATYYGGTGNLSGVIYTWIAIG